MGTGMGSVSMGREEARGQRNKSQQGQLQAVEMWVGREENADGNPGSGETWAPLSHALPADSFPERHISFLLSHVAEPLTREV